MNRFISIVAGFFLSLVGTFLGGYWQSRGVVALGDMRVPAPFVGGVVLIGLTVLAGFFGNVAPWTQWLSRLKAAAVPNAAQDAVTTLTSHTDIGAIPDEVAHRLGCVYHLRVSLADDEEAQELLDKIQVKVGRVSAKVK